MIRCSGATSCRSQISPNSGDAASIRDRKHFQAGSPMCLAIAARNDATIRGTVVSQSSIVARTDGTVNARHRRLRSSGSSSSSRTPTNAC